MCFQYLDGLPINITSSFLSIGIVSIRFGCISVSYRLFFFVYRYRIELDSDIDIQHYEPVRRSYSYFHSTAVVELLLRGTVVNRTKYCL